MRTTTCLDGFLAEMDSALRTLFKVSPSADENDPAGGKLSGNTRQLSGRLMRVNHAGEIAAQGLYRGQALTASDPRVREHMVRSAQEEGEHLGLCSGRLEQLGTHKSYLDPFWYSGAFMLGAVAGLAGDRWSLGFVAETERQVVVHLDDHIRRVPKEDNESLDVLLRLRQDEQQHAYKAVSAGAKDMVWPVPALMQAMSKVMTRTAFWF
jgi:3-demethoxyubiquinol 3-hydroxylase